MHNYELGLLGSIILRAASPWFMPGKKKARLSILIYHRVLPRHDPLLPGEVDEATFNWHMLLLAQHFNVLPLREALLRLKNGTLPERSVSVTFDDGYADNYEVALPILKKWEIPATFFITTSFLGGGCMWNDAIIDCVRHANGNMLNLTSMGLGKHTISTLGHRLELINTLIAEFKYLSPEARERRVLELRDASAVKQAVSPMMKAADVKALYKAGMEIGAHTATHPILANMDIDAARVEILKSKQVLEGCIGGPVDFFAYPNGKPRRDFGREHVDIVKELGFAAAVTTAWGVVTAQSDFWQLPRFTPWDKTAWRFTLKMLRNSMRKVEYI